MRRDPFRFWCWFWVRIYRGRGGSLLCPAFPSGSGFGTSGLVDWPTWLFEIEKLQCKNSICHLAILRGQEGHFSLRIAHRGQHGRCKNLWNDLWNDTSSHAFRTAPYICSSTCRGLEIIQEAVLIGIIVKVVRSIWYTIPTSFTVCQGSVKQIMGEKPNISTKTVSGGTKSSLIMRYRRDGVQYTERPGGIVWGDKYTSTVSSPRLNGSLNSLS